MRKLNLVNGLFDEIEAEIGINGDLRPIHKKQDGSNQSRIPPRNRSRIDDPKPDLWVNNFKPGDEVQSEFMIIIKMEKMPVENGVKALKIIPGIKKTIKINSANVEINPHHVEVVDNTDQSSSNYTAKIHYKMTETTNLKNDFLDVDPQIIHPDGQ